MPPHQDQCEVGLQAQWNLLEEVLVVHPSQFCTNDNPTNRRKIVVSMMLHVLVIIYLHSYTALISAATGRSSHPGLDVVDVPELFRRHIMFSS